MDYYHTLTKSDHYKDNQYFFVSVFCDAIREPSTYRIQATELYNGYLEWLHLNEYDKLYEPLSQYAFGIYVGNIFRRHKMNKYYLYIIQ